MQRSASSSSPPSWFAGAPVTKLLTLVLVASVFFTTTHSWTWPRSASSVTGAGLLTHWSISFERQCGSRKWMALIAWSYVMAMLLHVAVAMSLQDTEILDYRGPYHLIGVCLTWFHGVPRMHPRFWTLGPLSVSEKSLKYAWLVLACQHGGIGVLWALFLGIVSYLSYPQSLVESLLPNPSFVAQLSAAWLEASPAIVRAGTAGRPRRQRPARANAAPRPRPPPAAPFQQVMPDPAAVQQLMGLGFAQSQVEAALRVTHNHVERAADRLLSGG